jgi:hypothetical protein
MSLLLQKYLSNFYHDMSVLIYIAFEHLEAWLLSQILSTFYRFMIFQLFKQNFDWLL